MASGSAAATLTPEKDPGMQSAGMEAGEAVK